MDVESVRWHRRWSPLLGAGGTALGLGLLPMRWWRHGDLSPWIPALLVSAMMMMMMVERHGSGSRRIAMGLWLCLGASLADLIIGLWGKTLTAPLAAAAAVWAGTVTSMIGLLMIEELAEWWVDDRAAPTR
jgi:hypothetical protein